MDRERWRKVDRIVEAALECGVDARAELLARECAGDEGLRAEVESLLSEHDVHDSFLVRPRTEDALELLAIREEILIGKTVANYRLTRRLGRGGAGEVYLAQDIRLARPAAIKLLSVDCADNPEHVRRFRREALAASALNHPNILTIYEVGEWQGRDYIAAEFVEGATLRELIRRGPLPIPTCLDIAAQIATALAAAHGAGIVHRDIKPENIILRPDGVVKVLDFGIAKLLEPEDASISGNWSVTSVGVVIGTAAYMSPEQARGKDLDQRTDIWSLGVVLYELISGRLPFSGATPTDHVNALVGGTPERLTVLRPHTPARLEAIVSRAIAKDRDERYADSAILAEDLRELRSELDWQARVPRDWPWAPRWTSQIRRRTAIAGITLLLGIASAAGLFYRAYDLRRSPGRAAGPATGMIGSIAVLPLVNRSGTLEAEYLSDGITDNLINDLSEIPGLKVMSRGSVYRYKGQNVPPSDVGTALHVQAVLSGWMVRRSENLTVTLELVDARDSTHIWGGRYDRKLAEIPDIQEAIAREIADRLRLRLTKEDNDRLTRRYTRNSGAYQLYLKGQFYWLKEAFPSWRSGSAPDFVKSREYFEQAIEADPAYALGYSGLGHYYARAAAGGLIIPENGWPKAEAAFRKALNIDPDLPEARVGLAVIQWVNHRDWAMAERELRRAIQSNSNRPDTFYARLLAAEGRFDEAIEQARGALDLDPLSIRYSSALGRILYYARRYDEAIQQYRHALELDPRDATVHEDLGDAYERLGLGREAVAEWSTALTLTGDETTAATLRQAYARAGLPAAARMLARTTLQRITALRNRGARVPAVEYARAYMRLSQHELALRSLSKAYDEHTVFVLYINVDPAYDDLHHDSRFRELVKQLNIPS